MSSSRSRLKPVGLRAQVLRATSLVVAPRFLSFDGPMVSITEVQFYITKYLTKAWSVVECQRRGCMHVHAIVRNE